MDIIKLKKLEFDETAPIERYWQTIGLLKDEQDTPFFRVFVTGSKKSDVENFIQQIRKGTLAIRVTVTPTKRPRKIQPPPGPDDETMENAFSSSLHLNNVSIGISRLPAFRANAPESYQVTYEIDPDIFPLEGNDKPFTVTFEQNSADVCCTAHKGQVLVELYERDAVQNETLRTSGHAKPGTDIAFKEKKQGMGNWAVKVTGEKEENHFTLIYNKVEVR